MAVIEYTFGTVRVRETVDEIIYKWTDIQRRDAVILTKESDGGKIAVNMRNFMWITETE